MPRLTKIVTRQGDNGNTTLSGGQRVAKDSLRVSAYGTVDELSSQIGVAIAVGLDQELEKYLREVQNELFHLGSDLSFLEEDKVNLQIPHIEERHLVKLDQIVDKLAKKTGALDNFILPGGTVGAAHLHVARTICRRAERAVVTLSHQEKVGSMVIPYLNRLSDCLFVMARYENKQKGVPEPLWDSRV